MRSRMGMYRPFSIVLSGGMFLPRDETLRPQASGLEDSGNACRHKQKGVVISQNVSFSRPLFAHLPYRASGLRFRPTDNHRRKSYCVRCIHREVPYNHPIMKNPSRVSGGRLRHVWNALCLAIEYLCLRTVHFRVESPAER